MWLSIFSLYVMMWRMMKRIDVTVDDEGHGRDGGHTRKRPQTPTPLRYCGQIIVDKSIGVNVVYLVQISQGKGTPTKGGQVCN